jgi:hypothetical protein
MFRQKFSPRTLETKGDPVLEYVMMYLSPKLNDHAKQAGETVGP